ncbi:unnamed protein product [Trichogramma brassicae]|uniref:Integrase catalytic domain-containing protein n=1 Tax=Trichogramma brassicae TaxID=86971 RepID=A0A6H5J5Z6_9HYME|nr:unnamed protein product [Trichogramma brassicae]
MPEIRSKAVVVPALLVLFAANGSVISTYGSVVHQLELGLRRDFAWSFIHADVPYPILGADALAHFDLMPDLKRHRLIDNVTKLSVKGQLAPAPVCSISAIDPTHPLAPLLSKYPQVINPARPGSSRAKGVLHHLQTTGGPIAQRARRLAPDKLSAARKQFEQWCKEGTCRPSNSAWASPIHIVPKKQPNEFRVCGDYRKLNAITTPSQYPILQVARGSASSQHAGVYCRKCLCQLLGRPLWRSETISTDQGRQFKSGFFSQLLKILGTNRIRTTAYHPQSNGLIERWHRDFKAALMCYPDRHSWTKFLPFVMLGLRTRIRLDIDASAAEIVFGTPLRVPGEFFSPEDAEPDRKAFTSTFRSYMQTVGPVADTHHELTKPFVHQTLQTCTHVFIKAQPIKRALDPPFTGPFKIDSRISPLLYNIPEDRVDAVELLAELLLELPPVLGRLERIVYVVQETIQIAERAEQVTHGRLVFARPETRQHDLLLQTVGVQTALLHRTYGPGVVPDVAHHLGPAQRLGYGFLQHRDEMLLAMRIIRAVLAAQLILAGEADVLGEELEGQIDSAAAGASLYHRGRVIIFYPFFSLKKIFKMTQHKLN